MTRKALHLLVFVVVAAIVMPCAAKADIVYTFVKMTCAPETKTATLKAFYDEDESGEERTAHPEKDVYPLGERTGQPNDIRAHCDLGNNQTISFIAHQAALPKDDDLELFINRKPLVVRYPGLKQAFTLDDEWTMTIHQGAPNAYSIKFCPSRPSSLRTVEPQELERLREENKTMCDDIVVNNGVVVKAQTVEPTSPNE